MGGHVAKQISGRNHYLETQRGYGLTPCNTPGGWRSPVSSASGWLPGKAIARDGAVSGADTVAQRAMHCAGAAANDRSAGLQDSQGGATSALNGIGPPTPSSLRD